MFALLLGLLGISLAPGGDRPGDCAGAASAEIVRRFTSEWPLRGSGDPVSVYVQGLAGHLMSGLDGAKGKRWRFDVARNLAPSAFAAGDGYVVLTDGLVAFVRDESQLAAVLAHEMMHVVDGHFCRPPRPGAQEFRVGTLLQRYDAQAEEEADAGAVGVLRRTGFDPGAMVSVLRCLAESTPLFRKELEGRVRALERRGLAASGATAVSGSPGFRGARRAVEEDFEGLESAFAIENGLKRCR